MNATPRISVIIPVFNREKYIEECIESVLAQTYSNIEIICVDDGSTDRSVELLKQFGDKITLITHAQNHGSWYVRNTGVVASQGKFLAFLDSDDLWEKDKIEKQVAQFNAHPELGVSITYMKNFMSPELNSGILQFEKPIPGLATSTMMVRKNDFLRIGYFNNLITDVPDWFLRAKQANISIQLLPDVLVLRRVHDTNIGRVRKENIHANYLTIIRQFLKSKK